jgi:hypothetical protein
VTRSTPKNTPSPRGPLSNAERQRRFRDRRDARLRELEGLPPLRNATSRSGTVTPLRNAASVPVWTEETIDDALTQFRRRGDQFVTDYMALLTTPGLTTAETRAISARFIAWRKLFEDRARTSRRRLPAGIEQTSLKVTPIRKGGA